MKSKSPALKKMWCQHCLQVVMALPSYEEKNGDTYEIYTCCRSFCRDVLSRRKMKLFEKESK